MVRLNRQLSCRCRVDSLPRDERSNVECSRSMLWSTDSSCSFPCTKEPTGLMLALCCTMRGMPREFLMVKGAFSFREESKVEAVPSENAWSKHRNDKLVMFIYNWLFCCYSFIHRIKKNNDLSYRVHEKGFISCSSQLVSVFSAGKKLFSLSILKEYWSVVVVQAFLTRSLSTCDFRWIHCLWFCFCFSCAPPTFGVSTLASL